MSTGRNWRSLHRGNGRSGDSAHCRIRRVREDIEIRDGQNRCSYIVPGRWSVGLASWKDYCYDLKDSDIAKELTDDEFRSDGRR